MGRAGGNAGRIDPGEAEWRPTADRDASSVLQLVRPTNTLFCSVGPRGQRDQSNHVGLEIFSDFRIGLQFGQGSRRGNCLPSSRKPSAYSSRASGALRNASSMSSPAEVQPGRSGNQMPTAWSGPASQQWRHSGPCLSSIGLPWRVARNDRLSLFRRLFRRRWLCRCGWRRARFRRFRKSHDLRLVVDRRIGPGRVAQLFLAESQ